MKKTLKGLVSGVILVAMLSMVTSAFAEVGERDVIEPATSTSTVVTDEVEERD